MIFVLSGYDSHLNFEKIVVFFFHYHEISCVYSILITACVDGKPIYYSLALCMNFLTIFLVWLQPFAFAVFSDQQSAVGAMHAVNVSTCSLLLYSKFFR